MVYSEIQPIINNDKKSKDTTKLIFEKIKKETEIVGWKTKTRSKKNMSNIIYDVLTDNKFPDYKVDEITVNGDGNRVSGPSFSLSQLQI
ncbi:MAG: hypothetical protein WAZ77_09030 [Candidatus Nitrosopolaris sp.]